MIKGRRILVVVPARGGSKGVKNKNIQPVLGVPLVARVGQFVNKLSYVDKAVVSTDHPRIAAIAESAGLKAPFFRPARLSGDRIGDLPVLIHALQTVEKQDGCRYDIIVMLQPTCPLRQPKHVTMAIDKLIREKLDSVWTVSETDLKYHPLKQLTVDGRGRINYFDKRGRQIIARQQLAPVYYRNGAVYAFTRGALLKQKTIKANRTSAVILNDPMVSIDTKEDFRRVESILRKEE